MSGSGRLSQKPSDDDCGSGGVDDADDGDDECSNGDVDVDCDANVDGMDENDDVDDIMLIIACENL